MSKKSEIILLVSEVTGKNRSAIDERHHFKKDLQMDDIEIDDLFLRVEKTYGVTFTQSEMEKIENVKTLIAYTDYYLAIHKK